MLHFRMAAEASLAGGLGTDRVEVDFRGSGASSIDMAAGTVRSVDGPYESSGRFTSFETADISTTWPGGSGAWGPDTVDYRGTSGDDVVTCTSTRPLGPAVSVKTFGGDDQVLFTDTPTSDTRVDTGKRRGPAGGRQPQRQHEAGPRHGCVAERAVLR